MRTFNLPAGLQSRSRKESEVFGWSRSQIRNNTGSWSRIFCPSPDVQSDHFLHHTPELRIPVEMVQFLLNLCWIRYFLLCTTIFIDFNSQISFPYVKDSEILERSDILPPTPQPCRSDPFTYRDGYAVSFVPLSCRLWVWVPGIKDVRTTGIWICKNWRWQKNKFWKIKSVQLVLVALQ